MKRALSLHRAVGLAAVAAAAIVGFAAGMRAAIAAEPPPPAPAPYFVGVTLIKTVRRADATLVEQRQAPRFFRQPEPLDRPPDRPQAIRWFNQSRTWGEETWTDVTAKNDGNGWITVHVVWRETRWNIRAPDDTTVTHEYAFTRSLALLSSVRVTLDLGDRSGARAGAEGATIIEVFAAPSANDTPAAGIYSTPASGGGVVRFSEPEEIRRINSERPTRVRLIDPRLPVWPLDAREPGPKRSRWIAEAPWGRE